MDALKNVVDRRRRGTLAFLSPCGRDSVSQPTYVRNRPDTAAGHHRHDRRQCAVYWPVEDDPRHHDNLSYDGNIRHQGGTS